MTSAAWISIKDRLPHDPDWVLVVADGAINCMGFQHGKFSDWNHCPNNNVFCEDITHWMPLPERPTEAQP